ncbi:hypothetical protein EV210_103334 [Anaerospora hongkongensis]|uniref:Uncharacterized protein n=1 Tax=Anaerospora hongkongensis TaxID=244830 RepID=A0A4R1Q2R5_9FIRM|nr:hypothetical protein EV210_103334 [Anaerospora hongkongensis]
MCLFPATCEGYVFQRPLEKLWCFLATFRETYTIIPTVREPMPHLVSRAVFFSVKRNTPRDTSEEIYSSTYRIPTALAASTMAEFPWHTIYRIGSTALIALTLAKSMIISEPYGESGLAFLQSHSLYPLFVPQPPSSFLSWCSPLVRGCRVSVCRYFYIKGLH